MGLDFKKPPQKRRSLNQILVALVLILGGSVLLANVSALEISAFFD